jgi:hypothetical protein
MSIFTTEVVINSDHKLNLEINLPKNCPIGNAKVTLIIEPQHMSHTPKNRISELHGQGMGKIWMADNFDDPLADFLEYM